MRQPMVYWGTYPTNWAGYYYRETISGGGKHTGVDYNRGVNDRGDAVYSIASGTVVAILADGNSQNFGNAIIIKTRGTPPNVNGNNSYHRYLHLNVVRVSRGQKVTMGQRIGDVGGTGGFAPHLHLDFWTDRNGLGAHWEYHKWTSLASYEDPYRVIEANPNWNQQGDTKIMDTDAKVKAQYYTLRGSEGTAAERKGWIGRSYEEFNSTARPEVQGRTANINNLTNAVKTITAERDAARTQVAKLTGELLAERDRIKKLEADNSTLTAELEGVREGYKELEAMHQAQITELEQQIAVNNEEIERLNKELAACGTDCDAMSGWQMIVAGVKKLLGIGK